MRMSTFKVGDVVSGKIAGIQSYGAFVALDNSTQGLVHISEITHGFVKDIHDFLEVGQEVKVKILDIDEEKIKSVFLLERQRKHQKNNQLKRNKFHLAKTTKVLTLYAIN